MSRKKRSDASGGEGIERRKHPRLHVEGVSGGFLFSTNAKILNLSLDGMALETSDYLQVGRSYSLKLTQGEEELALNGSVVWCRMMGTTQTEAGDTIPVYSAGLHFDNLLKGTAREVHRFLGSNAVISLEKRLYGRFRLHESETADVDYRASFRVEKISLNGMEVDSDTFVEPDTVLDLEIRIGSNSLTTSGRVVHGTQLEPQPGIESASHLGIEFLDMDEETEKVIQGLIRDAIR
ncbi:MAG: PilZ domain-containing protein [Thermoanaerobaculia bacterium]